MVNLGTPDAPDKASVRRYLKEFLWDPRVVEMARPIWWLVLHSIILNTRPARSARAYQSVWRNGESPLMEISKAQHTALKKALRDRFDFDVPVALAMRYGRESIADALAQLEAAHARRILVLPMYPQYSATTTASVFDAVNAELMTWRWLPEMRFINQYHDHPGYISALAESVRQFKRQHSDSALLLMSFHGIPKEYFDKGDPYYCHCQKTARLLAESLGLEPSDYRVTFQSRLGPRQWLTPYTNETLKALAADGVSNVQVICPGFSADCLETLEEIAVENRDLFLAAGGSSYEYIPCLNDNDAHMAALVDIVALHTSGWMNTAAGSTTEPSVTKQRALASGADQ